MEKLETRVKIQISEFHVDSLRTDLEVEKTFANVLLSALSLPPPTHPEPHQ